MKQHSSLIVPIFPLNNTVLPDESIAIHVFEPQYRQLFEDCRNGKEFGIVYFNEKYRSNFGTTVHIDQIVNVYPDGTSDIIVKGNHIFELHELLGPDSGRLYSNAKVNLKIVETSSTEELNVLFRKFLQESGKMIHDEDGHSIFSIANRLEISQENKNKLISLYSHGAMVKFLLNETRFLLMIKQQEKLLDKNFSLN